MNILYKEHSDFGFALVIIVALVLFYFFGEG